MLLRPSKNTGTTVAPVRRTSAATLACQAGSLMQASRTFRCETVPEGKIAQHPALPQPANAGLHGGDVAPDRVPAAEGVDGDHLVAQLRHAGQQLVAHQADVVAHAGQQVAQHHTVGAAERVVGHHHHRPAGGDLRPDPRR